MITDETRAMLPEKVVHKDIYIYPLNVMSPGRAAISEQVMKSAVIDFNDKEMRFGEYCYRMLSMAEPNAMSRHLTIDIENVSHIPRNLRVEDGWLVADIEVRPRTPKGAVLHQLMGDSYPAKTAPQDVQNAFIFRLRYIVPNPLNDAEKLLPRSIGIITIDVQTNPHLRKPS